MALRFIGIFIYIYGGVTQWAVARLGGVEVTSQMLLRRITYTADMG